MVRILIMGLPGSGKTTLATELSNQLGAHHLNADEIRKEYNDWDFSELGRLRQAERMRRLADLSSSYYVVADFVAPTSKLRRVYDPDILIWMDTVHSSRYEDTDKIFKPPTIWDYRVTEFDSEKWANIVATNLNQLQQHLKFSLDNTIT